MTDADRSQRIAEAKHLLASALSILNSGSFPESAIWRAVDAAGLVAETLSADTKKGLIGLESITGRGNVLVQR
jgi:hypothetical protein